MAKKTKTKKPALAKAKPKNKAKQDTKKKEVKKDIEEAPKKEVKNTPDVKAPEKGKKNYACFIDGKYWRFYSDKKDAESFCKGRGKKQEIATLEDGKIKEYEAAKARMIAKNEEHKDSMASQPGGMPDTWQRTFRGVPKL